MREPFDFKLLAYTVAVVGPGLGCFVTAFTSQHTGYSVIAGAALIALALAAVGIRRDCRSRRRARAYLGRRIIPAVVLSSWLLAFGLGLSSVAVCIIGVGAMLGIIAVLLAILGRGSHGRHAVAQSPSRLSRR